MFSKKVLQLFAAILLPILLLPAIALSQVTTSSMSGVIKTATGEALVGATVTAIHEPTGVVYKTQTRTGGRFEISNMNPGGPYSVDVSFVNFATEKRSDIYLSLGEVYKLDASLKDKANDLTEVTVTATTRGSDVSGKGGAEVSIGRDKMANLPSVGRNLSDYLRFVPQVKITGDGGVAIAGQNNRYNSFYIDGAVNNDVFGLAASGTNGGQASVAPISIDAIDQFQVVISPYDASIGNFTGGAINAVTRSGTNTTQGSIYGFYRNQDLTGKSPTGPKDQATKLGKFSAKTYGFRIGGPIIKSKLFYFVNFELQRDDRPQPFSYSQYGGSYTQDSINKLVNFLKTTSATKTWSYDPGSYLDIPERINADRVTVKFDWNVNSSNRLSVSHRFNKGERYVTSAGSSTRINFFNAGYIFPSTTNSTSLELKSSFKNGKNNRLLITYTAVEDDRGAIGSPFPRVEIEDQGPGRQVIFGTENFSTSNLLRQRNFNLLDWFKFNTGKHYMTLGTDNELSYSYNAFIRDNYGTYRYSSIYSFMNSHLGATNPQFRPVTYNRSYSLVDNKSGDNTEAAAEFNTLRLGLFLNDEIRVNERFTLNLGLRADWTKFMDKPKEDKYFNDTARALITPHYNLEGARSGQIAKVPVSLSPRVGFTYKIPEENITIRGGFGWFTGRIPLVWPGGVYNLNGVSIGGVTANTPNVAFRADPFNQYTATDFGLTITNKGELNLITEEFKLPKLFRTSMAVDKRFGKGWLFSIEAIFSKNINEIDYTQVNLFPATLSSVGPDRRSVYSFSGTPTKIVPRYNQDIFLLSNNKDRKGFAYNVTFTLDKAFRNGFAFNMNYTYGTSIVLNEGTSSQNLSQWRFMETVNGRNNITLSQSDFDPGHRINAYVSKKFTYAKSKLATTLSLVYNAQSGSAFSYVYGASMVGDRARGETNDLIYVPTAAELQGMTFETFNGFTPQQQKDALNQFIENDGYLKDRRGNFAERNGARLPFTHLLDLKIQQDFNIRMGKNRYQFQITYDMFNFTNFLNRDWGRTYFMTNDNYSLIRFNGYVSATNLTPRYSFDPTNNTRDPYSISTSTVPGLSARWASQLGIRFNFN